MSAARISAAGAVFAGAIAHNKLRSALAVLAIALGVALGYAVQLITQSAVNELARGAQLLSGDADLQVRGPRRGFDEALYPELARLPEVALASPVVEVDAMLADRDEALQIIGEDPFRAAAMGPASRLDAGDPLDALRPDTVFLSPAAAAWLGVGAGDRLRFQVGLGEVSLRVGGLVPAGAQQRFARMDIAGAQTSFDRLGLLSRVDLRLKPGVDAGAFRDRLQARLPAGVAVERAQDALATAAGVSRAYRINMNVLALVALFTGGLLVFSTQVLSVLRRRTHFALLRVLGVTRRRLVCLLVAEGALLGAIGSMLGIPAGFLLAYLAVRITGPDLGSGYFRGIAADADARSSRPGALLRARDRGGAARRPVARAGGRARGAGAGAARGRRRARLHPPAADRAGTRRARRRSPVRARPAGGRLAAVRLRSRLRCCSSARCCCCRGWWCSCSRSCPRRAAPRRSSRWRNCAARPGRLRWRLPPSSPA